MRLRQSERERERGTEIDTVRDKGIYRDRQSDRQRQRQINRFVLFLKTKCT